MCTVFVALQYTNKRVANVLCPSPDRFGAQSPGWHRSWESPPTAIPLLGRLPSGPAVPEITSDSIVINFVAGSKRAATKAGEVKSKKYTIPCRMQNA